MTESESTAAPAPSEARADAGSSSEKGTPEEAPSPEGPGPEAPAEKVRTPSASRGPREVDWVAPSRIAAIVAFAIALALFFGTGARLLQIPNSLPLSGLLALAGGVLAVPSMVLFVLGRDRLTPRCNPLLALSVAAGFASYFVGGTVGVPSSATLGAGILAFVVLAMVGHPARESRRRRVRRIRRWCRNAALLGILLLLVAAGSYVAYTDSPSVAPLSFHSPRTAVLAEGTALNETLVPVTGGAGDVLYLIVGTENASFGVTGSILNSAGVAMANVTSGTFANPQTIYLQLIVDPGTYTVELRFPGSVNAPSQLDVEWVFGDIPAGVQVLTGTTLSAAWSGFVLVIVGGMIWFMARLPEEPATPAPPAPESLAGAGAEPAASSTAGSTPEGASREGLKTSPEVSDDGKTDGSEVHVDL